MTLANTCKYAMRASNMQRRWKRKTNHFSHYFVCFCYFPLFLSNLRQIRRDIKTMKHVRIGLLLNMVNMVSARSGFTSQFFFHEFSSIITSWRIGFSRFLGSVWHHRVGMHAIFERQSLITLNRTKQFATQINVEQATFELIFLHNMSWLIPSQAAVIKPNKLIDRSKFRFDERKKRLKISQYDQSCSLTLVNYASPT